MHNGTFPKGFKTFEYNFFKSVQNYMHDERCMLDEMNVFFDDILSKFQCGFRKGCSVQHCQLYMIKKIKKIETLGEFFGCSHRSF